MNIFVIIAIIFFILNLLFALSLIFIERKSPNTTWAWLFIFILLPGIGFIIYLILGQNFSREKLFDEKTLVDECKRKALSSKYKKNGEGKDEEKQYFDLRKMNFNNCGARYTENNQVEIFTNGDKKFKALLNDIKNAKKYIHIEYYIFKKDALGKEILSALEKKLKEGVTVRLLVDGMGSKITKRALDNYLKLGGKFSVFFPGILPHINTRINYRNHRKIVVIDGQYGYVGGFNVGDEYLGKSKRIGNWRDTHVKILGSAVNDLNERFILDWCYAAKEDIKCFEKYICDSEETGKGVGVQIVTSGPDHDEEYIKNAYIKMINNAKSNIYLTTPYFVPDESLIECLRIASLSGVDVKILIPGNPDHKFMGWAASAYIGTLIKAGAEVYYYKKGFVHAKVLVVDSSVVSIGTANMDIRSFRLNFEVNAFIFSKEKALETEKSFFDDLKNSEPIKKENFERRSKGLIIKESIIRLLSPIL